MFGRGLDNLAIGSPCYMCNFDDFRIHSTSIITMTMNVGAWDAQVDIDQPPSLAAQLVEEWSDRLESEDTLNRGVSNMPVSNWMESHYLIDRPRDPDTAALLDPGGIRLADYQKRVLKEAFRRDGDGKLIYNTIVWSEPKKSGKTAIAAGAGLYIGQNHGASHIYCMANDGKQSQDRIFNAMARCLILHNRFGGIFQGCKAIYSPPTIVLPSETVIEAVPCNPEGEAGAEPLMTIWSEMWGYAQQHKERLWSEMTIPPTLYGYALRWVESYAGYVGESIVLEKLYDVGVNHGKRHPHFPDVPVYVNESAAQLTLWSHEPKQPWQTPAYYAAEEQLLSPNEFRRIHRNEWVSSTTALLDDMLLWDRCEKPYPKLEKDDSTPVVIAIDAAYASEGDCAAIVMVSRHPDDDWDQEDRRVVLRHAVAFQPSKGEKLDFSKTLEPAIRRLCESYNVYMVVYDPYQLHKMCTDLAYQGIAPFKEFSQAGRRLRADKQLYDMIIHQQFVHNGDPILREHIQNCSKKEQGRHMRFVKNNRGDPIDLAVATSMAVDECLTLNM